MRKKHAVLNTKRKVFAYAFRATIPVLTGYLVLGIGFGLLLSDKGYGPFYALFMSMAVFAGSMEYAAVDLIGSGASLLTFALTTLAVNARHIFYGITMVDRYKGRRGAAILRFMLSDETFSLVCDDDIAGRSGDVGRYYLYVSVLDYCYWQTGSFLGGVIGEVLPFNTEGIDFVLTALFITIFTEQWLGAKDHRPALLGLTIPAVCLLLFGSGSFLIPAMVFMTGALLLMRGKGERQNG